MYKLETAMSNTYINIKSEWLTEWRLTPAEAVVYGYLYGWLVEGKKDLKQTQADMAKAVGMDERRFKRHLAHLMAYGCVATERVGLATTYHLHARMLLNEGVSKMSLSDKNDTQCQKCHSLGDKNDTDSVSKMSPTTLYNIKDNITYNIKPENVVSGGEEKVVEEVKEPKAPQKAKAPRKASPYTFEEQRLHGDLKRIYDEEWKAAHGEPFYWSPTAMAALVKIKKQIVFLMPESDKGNTEVIKDNFRIFVHLTLTTDGWYRANGTPQVISSKFNELYTQLKNGKQQHRQQQQGVSDEYLQRIAAEVAAEGGLAF